MKKTQTIYTDDLDIDKIAVDPNTLPYANQVLTESYTHLNNGGIHLGLREVVSPRDDNPRPWITHELEIGLSNMGLRTMLTTDLDASMAPMFELIAKMLRERSEDRERTYLTDGVLTQPKKETK